MASYRFQIVPEQFAQFHGLLVDYLQVTLPHTATNELQFLGAILAQKPEKPKQSFGEYNRHTLHWNEMETARRRHRVIAKRYFVTSRTNP